MNKNHPEWTQEQDRVEQVTEKARKKEQSLSEEAGGVRSEIVDIRNRFWEDVSVNFEGPDDAIETAASMKQQAEVLSERERSHRLMHKQGKILRRLQDNPYFGRIDFHEVEWDVVQEKEAIYIGIASFYDDETDEFLIYDWRAPISSMYYDYTPGPAGYQTLDGRISGEMELKRQFLVRCGQIQSMFDTGVTIGDELLQEVLGQNSDSQMKSIVATIQREQNQIIRDEKSKLLIVQGAAGSGKTSAALQRVAYLLYRNRDTLSADQILLFSPNAMFNSYIETVLPELGEENMQQTTFQEYLEHQVGEDLEVEDPFSLMEYTLSQVNQAGYQIRMAGVRWKAGMSFLELIEKYMEQLGQRDLRFQDLMFRDQMIVLKSEIEEHFYTYDRKLPIPNRLKLTADWLLKQLRQFEVGERKADWVDEEIELLDNEAYYRVHQRLQKEKGFTDSTFDDFDRERTLLAQLLLRDLTKPLRKEIENFTFVDVLETYRQLFTERELISKFWDIAEQTVNQLDSKILPYEDATPFVYFKALLLGFQINTKIRHVFIDESQDYSPFQYAFLRRLFPKSTMTILGDLNQSIYVHTEDGAGFEPLCSLFVGEHIEKVVLTKSYRSTKQIGEFTQQLLIGGERIEPFDRPGRLPIVAQVLDEQEQYQQMYQWISELQGRGHQSIALICKDHQKCEQVFEKLRDEIPVSLIKKATLSFAQGIIIIPAYLSKGIEFDAVILFDASDRCYHREEERKLFYTACTRAMHELCLCSRGEVSRFLAGVDEGLYKKIT
ncbi:DNA helicase-2 / ATP-dependent DNA helicase PcrA [Thermoactinomyces sp. DSM 45891]|uniref:RNA polymerase recycling motor HelD n=1 Tax=Thermoactinomyces sp. DSM 45891 TaxID=1761907 RepID=UPI00091E2569|nr:RNA polymerase recycling motor HelD [Thermoactinomyces sp. DSM 45891]SFX12773.1 DNA helicase-2 / ATP-dependent DNA helicase PcrA [Thermoactinomyces sp. DSM 45891]